MRLISYYLEYLSWAIFRLKKFKHHPIQVKTVLIYNECPLGDFFSSMRVLLEATSQNPRIEFRYAVPPEIRDSVRPIFNQNNLKFISISEIKGKKYDLTVLLTLNPLLNASQEKLGFIVGNEYHSIRTSLRHIFMGPSLHRKIPPIWRHKTKQELEIYKKAGLLKDDKLLFFKPKRNSHVEAYVKSKKIKNFVVVHPSGRNFSKIFKEGQTPSLSWKLGRFAEVTDYIIKSHNIPVILTGSADEKFIAEKIIHQTKNKKKIFNAAGYFTIPEFTDLIYRAKLVISIDTSTIHIAELVGTKTIALFGPTFVEEIGLYGDPANQINLYHPEKAIRNRSKGSAPDEENKSMNSITSEEVINAIDKLLK